MVYALACVGYLVLTRPLGTPFQDSLTEEQRQIKREAARVRGRAFAQSLVGALVLVSLWRPLDSR